jgi:hypothetical protein
MMLQFLILRNCPCLTKVTSHVGRLKIWGVSTSQGHQI